VCISKTYKFFLIHHDFLTKEERGREKKKRVTKREKEERE
jgi:hypothetical protein